MFTVDNDLDDERPPATEVNALEQPAGQCEWDRGCSALATHNVRQYDSVTGETLIEGCVDADFCEPHARAMVARISEYET